ncbi:aminomethyl-transferring glycine dehydrogenase subunit GcvPB [Halobellus sp. GM3]|uniref:aminomethyl-transferring glycine dehydrogenase subunit GcvPB n=1 Tax=Halobellus sp. GM3 TaxID=3458410 RepID=UPI00403DF29D
MSRTPADREGTDARDDRADSDARGVSDARDDPADSNARDAPAPYRQARWTDDGRNEPLLCEKSSASVEVETSLPSELTRETLDLPDLREPEVARHYTRLSQMNYGIESGPFPLGSCTMKYNPKFTEDAAADPNAAVHPLRADEDLQGPLGLLCDLQEMLASIGGMDAVTLQPPAGAAGEFTGILVAKAYHEANDDERSEVIVPASAHGTNFASAAMAGYDVVELPSGDDGRVDLDALEAAVSEETALLMLTNPNTLGTFERDIETIAETVHDAGGLLYYDGANLNALLGQARPGDMGFDVMHFNLHKTFATPHGGGGPGAGPVGVTGELAEFLPNPHVRERADGTYERYEPEQSIGGVHEFSGNWLVLVKAYAYILRHGDEGLANVSETAVLNANYLASQIDFEIPYEPFHHEFVASADADAADVAKRMLDYGVHPPTTKWPEIVPEALMTEPTETETKARLDDLAAAFNAVAAEDESTLAAAPNATAARRIDQATAARDPTLSWHGL